MSTETDEKKARPYYVLYIPGGVLWGVMPLVVCRFLEDITRLPLSQQFNMFAGSSTGSIILSALNIPDSKGSGKAKYSVADVLDFYKTIGPHIFPPRSAYYERQLIMDIVKLGHELFKDTIDVIAEKLDDALSLAYNKIARPLHQTHNPVELYQSRDFHLFRRLNGWTFAPMNRRIGRWIDYGLAASRYEISVLKRSLDSFLRFSDTQERAKLGDTIISHHVTAMNVSRNDPAIFFHYKNPVSGATDHNSDPEFDLDDMATASSAAPTIFEVHQARNGQHYTDIAFFDTPQTCISSLLGQAKDKLDIRLVMIGTGKVDQEIDVKRLNSMLFLQQLIGRLGRHLLGLPQRFILKRDLISLRQNLGADNVIEIDNQVNRPETYERHLNDPRVRAIAAHLGIDLYDRDPTADIARLEGQDLFDSSPEALRTLVSSGWDMIWENLDHLLPLSRDLLANARDQGHITDDEAQSRIAVIEHFMAAARPADDTPSPPDLGKFRVSETKHREWLTFEEIHHRKLSDKFRYIGRRIMGREPDFIPPPPHVVDPGTGKSVPPDSPKAP